jgi:CheY-like chemotaxis protein
MLTLPSSTQAPLPEHVLVVPARGGGSGHAALLRELIERLGTLGVAVEVFAELELALRAIADDPDALLVIDVDDANHGFAAAATISSRIGAIVGALPDAAPVAIATRPTSSTVLTCQRAGAIAFIDLGADSFEAAIQLLAGAAQRRAHDRVQGHAIEQLRSVVEELLRDLVKTERRTIDLERQLAELGTDGVGLPADLDHRRAPVVLVVEDDREVSDTLVGWLEYVGLTTVAFVTGEEATAHAERMMTRGEPLDLVIVDLNLPGIDGLEVVRRLRKEAPYLAAFLISGYADPTLSARAADLGVVEVAVKPFDDPRALVGRIQREATEAMARTREHGYLQRIKVRHERVLDQYRALLADLSTP